MVLRVVQMTNCHLKIVPDPLWKRALKNRRHWDNYQIAFDAFELARKLAADHKSAEEKRGKELRAREAAKQRQIKCERALRIPNPPAAPLPIQRAPSCPRCGGAMIFKPGIAHAMHVKRSCSRTGRVTFDRCTTSKCWKPAVSNGLCTLCASRTRRLVIDTPITNEPSKNSSGGSDNRS